MDATGHARGGVVVAHGARKVGGVTEERAGGSGCPSVRGEAPFSFGDFVESS